MTKVNAQKQTNNAQKVNAMEEIIAKVQAQAKTDKMLQIYNVTGYVTVKYGNKVLMELHNKKRSIAHITFSSKQKLFETLQAKKLITRIVPKSYGWKFNVECLLQDELAKNFDKLLASAIDEAKKANKTKTEQKIAKKA